MSESKKRAELRALANKEETIIQIGKEGLTDTVLAQIDHALTARELIKGRILETAMLTPREAAEIICEKLHCEPVQCIGTKFVVYRENPEKRKKAAEASAVKRKTTAKVKPSKPAGKSFKTGGKFSKPADKPSTPAGKPFKSAGKPSDKRPSSGQSPRGGFGKNSYSKNGRPSKTSSYKFKKTNNGGR